MITHVPGFQSFFQVFLGNFVLSKLATSSIRVKRGMSRLIYPMEFCRIDTGQASTAFNCGQAQSNKEINQYHSLRILDTE